MENREKYMREALREAGFAAAEDEVPIGAVIVCRGRIVGKGHNMTERLSDPTAHAEVSAIRAACAKLGDFKLSGCTIYSSCEPCPMCLSALYWAGVERIFYGNTKQDAKSINFDDSFIYDQIALDYSERAIPCINFMREEALAGFKAWVEKVDKVLY